MFVEKRRQFASKVGSAETWYVVSNFESVEGNNSVSEELTIRHLGLS